MTYITFAEAYLPRPCTEDGMPALNGQDSSMQRGLWQTGRLHQASRLSASIRGRAECAGPQFACILLGALPLPLQMHDIVKEVYQLCGLLLIQACSLLVNTFARDVSQFAFLEATALGRPGPRRQGLGSAAEIINCQWYYCK